MEYNHTIDRRRFVKMFTLGASFGCVSASGVGRIFAEINPTATGGGVLNLKVSSFPVLGAENGRLRLGLNGINTSVSNPQPTGAFYPFYVTRGPDVDGQKVFHSFSSRCTHAGTIVGNSTTPGQLRCPNHSSRFNIDGSVLPGQQARFDLETYQVEFDGDDALAIVIPGLGYALEGSGIQTGVGERVAISVRLERLVTYEVVARASLSEDWSVVPFSASEDGAAELTEISGLGRQSTLYVDAGTAPTGFFAVRARVSEI